MAQHGVSRKPWLLYTLITTISWGIWGAFIDAPEKVGFPATLSYVVWSLTMVPCALVALHLIGWRLERDVRSVVLGMVIGVLGSGGQLLLFEALRLGPAYLIFPVVSLAPAVTTLLSWLFLGERTGARGWTGIALALIGLPLLSYQPAGGGAISGYFWMVLSIVVFFAWGVQAYYWKVANATMTSEGIFFYMMVGGLVFVPAALLMTHPDRPVNLGFRGPGVAAIVQLLNSVGALTIVYAFRYGKAIIVSPLANAVAPVITVLISLGLSGVVPHPVVVTGMVLATVAMFLIALEPDQPADAPARATS